MAWVASVNAVTGAVIRLDSQAASSMATPAVSAPRPGWCTGVR